MIGERRALGEPQRMILVAGQSDGEAQLLQPTLESAGDVEDEILFFEPAVGDRPFLVTAMTRVDDDETAGRRRLVPHRKWCRRGRRRRWPGGLDWLRLGRPRPLSGGLESG